MDIKALHRVRASRPTWPPLKAESLADGYRVLAEFNGTVLAGKKTLLGALRHDLATRFSGMKMAVFSGYSGGGKKMIAEYEAERTNKALNAPRPYGLALHHKHLPEMAAVTGLDTAPNFVPVVADYYAGMETMIPLDVTALGVSAPQVASALAEYYAGQPMIKVHPLCEGTDGGFLAANKLAGKDTLEIYCLANPDGTRMQLISLFDNLGKGSSGAAVQCMNLMLGLEETKGLAR